MEQKSTFMALIIFTIVMVLAGYACIISHLMLLKYLSVLLLTNSFIGTIILIAEGILLWRSLFLPRFTHLPQ